MIDFWLFFCLSILIAIMAVHTWLAAVLSGDAKALPGIMGNRKRAVGVKGKEDMLSKIKRLNKHAKIAFAFAIFAFNAVFWSLALSTYFTDPSAFIQLEKGHPCPKF